MSLEKSNPSIHLNSNITHHLSWPVICNAPVKKLTRKILEALFIEFNAPVKKLTRKILEAYFIELLKPTLNDQIESDLLYLFKNGTT